MFFFFFPYFFFFLHVSHSFSLAHFLSLFLFLNSTFFTTYKLYITIFSPFWSVLRGTQAPAKKTTSCT